MELNFFTVKFIVRVNCDLISYLNTPNDFTTILPYLNKIVCLLFAK
jgi:hypothetical protein